LAEIPDKIKLLPPNIVDSVLNLKTEVLNEKTLSLDLMETLIALNISGPSILPLSWPWKNWRNSTGARFI